jgi:hypothetical protein
MIIKVNRATKHTLFVAFLYSISRMKEELQATIESHGENSSFADKVRFELKILERTKNHIDQAKENEQGISEIYIVESW